MSGQDLYLALQGSIRELNAALLSAKERGLEYAEAKRKYHIALSKELLYQKNQGMQMSIIGDVCRGKEDIARLRFDRDRAEALYNSAREAINVKKLEIRVLDAQIQREYIDG